MASQLAKRARYDFSSDTSGSEDSDDECEMVGGPSLMGLCRSPRFIVEIHLDVRVSGKSVLTRKWNDTKVEMLTGGEAEDFYRRSKEDYVAAIKSGKIMSNLFSITSQGPVVTSPSTSADKDDGDDYEGDTETDEYD